MLSPRAALGFVALLVACDAPPIEWSEPVLAVVDAANTQLSVDSAGHTTFVTRAPISVTPPTAAGLCAATLQAVPSPAHVYAVWWSVRPDSSAILYAASSADSARSWQAPVAVDTSDVSSRGCSRPPPSLTTVGDDLQLAYSMIAPEGTGVFYAHFMGSMLHSPVSVIYGERLVATAIAAQGDRVIVAYEEPNGTRQQIDVAVSSTQGHVFEVHTTASRSVDEAVAPAVALAGRSVAVAWTTQRTPGGQSSRVVRVGRLR